jgi:hypothetical protein
LDFHGSLEEFHLPDIIQFLSGASKTGVLRLFSGRDEGAIYIEKGRIVHATATDAVGEEAVYALMLLGKGKFDFEPDVKAQASTVQRSSTNLLMEAARRKDEWESIISKRIPDVDLVPEFVLPAKDQSGKQITLNTSEWVVLSKIDGERTVRAIAKVTGISTYQACRLLYGLVSTGLIRLRRPDTPEKDGVEVDFPD